MVAPDSDAQLVAALHANSAQALLKQRLWLECIEQCNAALRADPSHKKAAWRGATAAIEVSMHDVAVGFVEGALLLQPQCLELLELRQRLGPLPEPSCEDRVDSGDDVKVSPCRAASEWSAPPRRPRVAPPGKDKAD